jgi:hypothetical protein
MTRQQLAVWQRRVEARLRALEASQGARPARHKRVAAPRPDGGVVAAREALWARYLRLEMTRGHGKVRLTKLSFAMRFKLNPTEFCRWLSPTDRRGIAEGSGPDLRFRESLAAAIRGLEGRTRSDDPKSKAHDESLIAVHNSRFLT